MDLRSALRLMMLGCLVTHATIACGEEKRSARKAIELDAAKLDAVVGRYQLEPGHALTISRFRDRLFASTTGDPAFAIVPESETVCFCDAEDVRITFIKDERGKVTAARYDHGTFNRTGK